VDPRKRPLVFALEKRPRRGTAGLLLKRLGDRIDPCGVGVSPDDRESPREAVENEVRVGVVEIAADPVALLQQWKRLRDPVFRPCLESRLPGYQHPGPGWLGGLASDSLPFHRWAKSGPTIFERPRLRRPTAGNPLSPIRGGIHGSRSWSEAAAGSGPPAASLFDGHAGTQPRQRPDFRKKAR
jgi:hypothetical protein